MTDNASNMSAAAEIAGLVHVRFFVHSLNLPAQRALKYNWLHGYMFESYVTLQQFSQNIGRYSKLCQNNFFLTVICYLILLCFMNVLR